ncbi:hypothetical protein BGZ73_002326 [Actinomortierella ambigua]|nr:hypothetical protein BGZ73_002326 [Actinomortierella ambigua]
MDANNANNIGRLPRENNSIRGTFVIKNTNSGHDRFVLADEYDTLIHTRRFYRAAAQKKTPLEHVAKNFRAPLSNGVDIPSGEPLSNNCIVAIGFRLPMNILNSKLSELMPALGGWLENLIQHHHMWAASKNLLMREGSEEIKSRHHAEDTDLAVKALVVVKKAIRDSLGQVNDGLVANSTAATEQKSFDRLADSHRLK